MFLQNLMKFHQCFFTILRKQNVTDTLSFVRSDVKTAYPLTNTVCGGYNQTVEPQKMARDLKFRTYEVEGLYYPCSENKGADQLRGYREADLRLCFRLCKKRVFS